MRPDRWARCIAVGLLMAVQPGARCLADGAAVSIREAVEGRSFEACFNYGCASRVPVLFLQAELARIGELFGDVADATDERERIAWALAELYRLIGGQTPVFMDVAGNLRDEERQGRMDCIDHSTNTTRLLELMAERGWLRHHEVLEPTRRGWLFAQHFSAVIEERGEAVTVPDHVPVLLVQCDCPEVVHDIPARPSGTVIEPARFAVDTWFVDHGEPAVILPLADWLNGEGPNVQ